MNITIDFIVQEVFPLVNLFCATLVCLGMILLSWAAAYIQSKDRRQRDAISLIFIYFATPIGLFAEGRYVWYYVAQVTGWMDTPFGFLRVSFPLLSLYLIFLIFSLAMTMLVNWRKTEMVSDQIMSLLGEEAAALDK